MVYVEHPDYGWLKSRKSGLRMTFLRADDEKEILACRRRKGRVAATVPAYPGGTLYRPYEIGEWWLESIKDSMQGHQFAFRNRTRDGGRRVIGSVALSHCATGLCVSSFGARPVSCLEFYAMLLRQATKHGVSMGDLCLLRLLNRLLKVRQKMLESTAPEAVESLRLLGLDPGQTVEGWMGKEAYERAGCLFVRLNLTDEI